MSKKDGMLTELNATVKKIMDKSGSQLLKNMPSMWYNKDIPGSPFTGDVYYHSWFNVSKQEIEMQQGDDKKVQALVKCRIVLAISSMIDLLQNELKLLGNQK